MIIKKKTLPRWKLRSQFRSPLRRLIRQIGICSNLQSRKHFHPIIATDTNTLWSIDPFQQNVIRSRLTLAVSRAESVQSIDIPLNLRESLRDRRYGMSIPRFR